MENSTGGSNGFSLLEGGERSDKNNLTTNQRSSLSTRQSECCSFADETSWKIPFGLLSLFTFIAFILACVGVSMGSSNSDSIDSLNVDMNSALSVVPDPDAENPDPDCPYGDVTWGQEPIAGPGGTNFYQVVGGSKAAITWHSAMRDAQSRCYNKHKGYLVNIGSQAEDTYVSQLIQSTGGFSSGDNAWIGATDQSEEGTFSWIGPKKMVKGVPFFKDGLPIDGAYTNWADGEPNEGGASGLSEDCVSKYGGGDGKWNDKNCYYTNPFFVVEFGPPTEKMEEEYEEKYDDSLDDDALEETDETQDDKE